MPSLIDLSRYADARQQFSRDTLWDLFDGTRERLNIAHECVDRHCGPDRGPDLGPNREPAVRIVRAGAEAEAVSFDELSQWSSRVANWLIARGIGNGDRVAIMLEPSLAFYAALFGAMKCGAVAVPLFTLFGPDGLRLRTDDCKPALLLLPEGHIAHGTGVPEALGGQQFLDACAHSEPTFECTTSADDLALFQYTSGTTRELPEAVRHRHRAVVTVAVAALYATGVRPGDRFMCPSSPAWGHGLAHGTLGPLGLGVSVCSYAGQFDPKRLLEAIEEHGITNLSAAATHYRMMRQCEPEPRRNFQLEKLTFTGEPLDSETAQWAQRVFGTPVRSIYGTTEVGVILAQYPGADDFPAIEGSLGKPMPGLDVDVHDAEGRPCPPGQVGEIVLRRRDGWFSTKDRGHVNEQGHFFHDGRADDVIISAGWTISAKEVEAALLRHPDVIDAAVVGTPDHLRGLVVSAFVVTTAAVTVEDLQQFVRSNLSAHEYPRVVRFVEAIPKTPAGKTNRRAVREAFGQTPAGDQN